jgi:hypothetical protein
VAAPGRVELDEDVVGSLGDELVKRLADDDSDGALRLGNRLRLDDLLLAREQVGEQRRLGRERVGQRVLDNRDAASLGLDKRLETLAQTLGDLRDNKRVLGARVRVRALARVSVGALLNLSSLFALPW